MKVAALVLGCAGWSSACDSDEACSLNGLCGADGACLCDPAWSGFDCGTLDVAPNSASRIYSEDDSMSSWGGLPIWDEESQLYHLFSAEFVQGCSLGHWSPNSQVIRATSEQLQGPYEKQEVVLPPFHHNPTLTRAKDGTWLLYVIGRDVPADTLVDCTRAALGGDPAPGNLESNITLFSSQSLLGPWDHVGVVLAGDDEAGAWDADRTNPSAHADADGGVHLMYRGCHWGCGHEQMGMSIAPHWNCSVDVPGGCRYERTSVAAPLWSGPEGEDPFIFRDRRGGWHAMIHNLGHNGGFGCNRQTWHGCDVGGHAFSKDGLNWTLSDTIAFTTNITWTDGKAETLNRRERPQFVFAADGVTPLAMVTGVQQSAASCSKTASSECRSFTMAVMLNSQQPVLAATAV